MADEESDRTGERRRLGKLQIFVAFRGDGEAEHQVEPTLLRGLEDRLKGSERPHLPGHAKLVQDTPGKLHAGADHALALTPVQGRLLGMGGKDDLAANRRVGSTARRH